MPRILTICHECNETFQGKDGAACRFCHEVFCEECGDIVGRVCDTCGDKEEEIEEFVREDSKNRVDEEVYGEAGDIDYFGEDK